MKTDLFINGMGVLFSGGKGTDTLVNLLSSAQRPSADIHSISDKILNAPDFKKLRRLDRFSKIAFISAYEALEDSGISVDENIENIGIILATGLGPHATTFEFLDDILTYGDKLVSPTRFGHSLHSAATGYASSITGIRGPVCTISQFFHSFHYALLLADLWLKEKRCEYVLVGSAEEIGDVMSYVLKTRNSKDREISSFSFSDKSAAVPGEGSVFFLLSNNSDSSYCSISGIHIDTIGNWHGDNPDLTILDTDGLLENESEYMKLAVGSESLLASYAPLYGSTMAGSAFSSAIGALCIKNQTLFKCPNTRNPFNLNICDAQKEAVLKKIFCLRYDCSGNPASIVIEK